MEPRRALVCHTVPLDESGGGQRAAQLARELAARGLAVDYLYVSPRFDFARGHPTERSPSWPGVTARLVGELSRAQLEALVSPDALVLLDAPHPAFEPVFALARERGAPTVFELIDAWDSSLGAGWFDEALLQRLVRGASVVTGTARGLGRRLVELGRADALYLPNAADGRLFDPKRGWARPAELEAGRRALVYVGSLTGEWIGWHFLTQAARGQPEARFYLVGDAPPAVRGLRRLYPNLRFPGMKPIAEVPAFLAHADLTLLPFMPGKISDAVSPIKVFEYLAMGKRVVATPLPELEGYPNVTLASTSAEFAAACASAPPPDLAAASAMAQHTWACRVDQLLEAVRAAG